MMGDQELPMVEQVQLERDMNTYLVRLWSQQVSVEVSEV